MPVKIIVHRKTHRVLADVGKHPEKWKRGIEKAWYGVGQDGVNEAVRLMNLPKTGRFYQYQGRRYQASAPYEAPAIRSGRMVQSNEYAVRSWRQLEVGNTAKSRKGAPYPGFLEDGTRKSAKHAGIAPRQLFTQVANNMARNTEVRLLRAVGEELGV